MAHPYAGQAKGSEKARLKRLTGTAGKAHGSSSMYFKSAYPKGAGTQREYTISGGSSKRRPDRLAGGGSVGKKKRKSGSTTNIIISHAGGRGGSGGGGGAGPNPPAPAPVPVPINRPVPVPAGAGPAAAGPVPVRPPMPAAGGAPPMPMPPPGAGGPPPMPPMRPPGMKAGGAVKKAANGGKIGSASMSPGKGYKGFPNSPTTEVESAVSATKKGGSVGYAGGGAVKKRQFGGGMGGIGGANNPMTQAGAGQQPGGGVAGLVGQAPGRRPLPAQPSGALSGVMARPAQANIVPMPNMGTSWASRPAPGTTTTYAKKGGRVPHADEAEDKALIKKEFKKRGFAAGGAVEEGNAPEGGSIEGGGMAHGGIVKTPVTNASGGARGGKARKAKTRAAKHEPGQTGSPRPGHNSPPRGMAGSKYHQQGHGTK